MATDTQKDTVVLDPQVIGYQAVDHGGFQPFSVRTGRLGTNDNAEAIETVTLGLERLGIVLSIPASLTAKNVGLKSAIHAALFDPDGNPSESSDDPLIDQLLRARIQAEQSDGPNGAIYADCIRLALLTRLLSCPDQNLTEKAPLPKWRLKRAVEYIDTHYARSIRLADLASAAGLSPMHFASQFKASTGLRPRHFVLNKRVQMAQKRLVETHAPLVDIALSVGFQTQAHFTTVFKRFTGTTPYQWRRDNRLDMAS